MKRHILLAEWISTPWALMPERLRAYSAVLSRWAAGRSVSEDVMLTIKADTEAREARKASNSARAGGGIAVLPMYGVLTQRGNMADDLSGPGSTSTQLFGRSLRDALADDSIDGVLIDCDSPGGSVYGMLELAATIYESRGSKPIFAFVNSLCASAAYCACSQADAVYMTQGGEVGSIGVYLAHEDVSKALEAEGVAVTLVSAGKFKTEGNPYQPLGDDALAYLQGRVDDYYSGFVKAVATGRGVAQKTVREGMGMGRVVGADEAVSQNMIDGVATFDEVVSKLQAKAKRAAARSSSALAVARNQIAILG